jgi:hypothetical protein
VAVKRSPSRFDDVPSDSLSFTFIDVPLGSEFRLTGVAGATSPLDSTRAVRAQAEIAIAPPNVSANIRNMRSPR